MPEKVIGRIIEKRVKDNLAKTIEENKGGLEEGEAIYIFILRYIMEKILKKKRDVHILFCGRRLSPTPTSGDFIALAKNPIQTCWTSPNIKVAQRGEGFGTRYGRVYWGGHRRRTRGGYRCSYLGRLGVGYGVEHPRSNSGSNSSRPWSSDCSRAHRPRDL